MREFTIWLLDLSYAILLLVLATLGVLVAIYLISMLVQIWEYKHNNHAEIRAEFVNRLRGLATWYTDDYGEAEVYNRCNKDWNKNIDFVLAELEREELPE